MKLASKKQFFIKIGSEASFFFYIRIDILQKWIIDTLPPSKVKTADRAHIIFIKEFFFVLKHLRTAGHLDQGIIGWTNQIVGEEYNQVRNWPGWPGGSRLPGRCYISVAGLGDNIEYSAQKPWNIRISKYLSFFSKLIIALVACLPLLWMYGQS